MICFNSGEDNLGVWNLIHRTDLIFFQAIAWTTAAHRFTKNAFEEPSPASQQVVAGTEDFYCTHKHYQNDNSLIFQHHC